MRPTILLAVSLLAVTLLAAADAPPQPASFRQFLLDAPDPASLRATHESLCSVPHPSGTPGEWQTIEKLEKAFAKYGLEVQRHEFFPYLAHQGTAKVEVLDGDQRIVLPLQEKPLAEDPHSASPLARPGWNAYSGTGEVTAEVVYANYARKEDFEKLAEQGISSKGKIVIARYGEIFRGHKAVFAERAGAAGLLLFTDPDNAGYRRGIPYPEGGWANEHYIQRGSLLALDYPGDPLTPSAPASEFAPRLAPDSVAMPRIPVQPIGWAAAEKILSRMRGAGVPSGWQGGLPFAYRLTSGESLRVYLNVQQERRITKSANVLGVLRGSTHPDELVIVGCHFDAWTFGSGDPNAGTMVLMEMARSFGAAAKAGHRPARTIVFANWAGEEFGMLGSTEYCEAHKSLLEKQTVAYINMDMAAMGPDFWAASLPLLKSVMQAAASEVPQTGSRAKVSAWEASEKRSGHSLELGNLGGGSDHLPFMSHLGVPVAAFGASGSSGVSYHSNYETIAWYRKVVGADYEPARMVARIGNMLLLRLANDPLLPLDPTHYAPTIRGHLDALAKRHEGEFFEKAIAPLHARLETLETTSQAFMAQRETNPERTNRTLLTLERTWLSDEGLPGRPWYRSLYNATHPDTGYGASPLPLLDRTWTQEQLPELKKVVARYETILAELIRRLGPAPRKTDTKP